MAVKAYFAFRLSPYVIQTILGAVSVVGTVPALVSLGPPPPNRSL